MEGILQHYLLATDTASADCDYDTADNTSSDTEHDPFPLVADGMTMPQAAEGALSL